VEVVVMVARAEAETEEGRVAAETEGVAEERSNWVAMVAAEVVKAEVVKAEAAGLALAMRTRLPEA
jgi:hypothetical protein